MTALKVKINGTWTEVAGDIAPIQPIPQSYIDFVNFWTPTAWVGVTFQNGWRNRGGTFTPVRYRKVGDTVQMEGSMENGTMGVGAFTLPVGFRPPNDLYVVCSSFTSDATQVAQPEISIQASTGGVAPFSGISGFFHIGHVEFCVI